VSEPTSPVIKGWEVGLRLRERREQLGLTATTVGKMAGCTQAFISSVESGRPKLTADRLTQLCKLYEIDADESAELEALRTGSNERAWWHEYSGIFSAELQRYLGYEAGAEEIRSYHGELIHGLLQTEDYARAVILGGSPYIRLTEVDQRVECRMTRQQRLNGDAPLRLAVVISEAVLIQEVGGAGVMRRQLTHLAKTMEDKKNVEIRVIPFKAGAHPSLGSQFHLLSFSCPRLRSLLWYEMLTSTELTDDPSQVREYSMAFQYSIEKALSAEDSLRLIRQRAKEF
jgi:transcriptional regulator with XRE-family HTH domain